MSDVSNCNEMIDVRDIIARIEDLEPRVASIIQLDHEHDPARFAEAVATLSQVDDPEPETEELQLLYELMADLCGNGGDEHWRGDWYPVTLIRDSYFTDAMRELCEDIGDMPKGVPSYFVIDWEATARNLQVDYTSCEFDGVTYWYR